MRYTGYSKNSHTVYFYTVLLFVLYTIVNFTPQCGENRHTDIANFASSMFRLTSLRRRQRRCLLFQKGMAKIPIRFYALANEVRKNYCNVTQVKRLSGGNFYIRGRYPTLGHPLPWAISFFLNEKKINIFHLMHIALFSKVTY